MLAVGFNRVFATRVDDERAGNSRLFLKACVAVIPGRAVLLYLEVVVECLPRTNPRVAQSRDAVHVGRDAQRVPVNGGGFFKAVRHCDRNVIAFAPPQDRPWNRTVDGHRGRPLSRKVDGQVINGQFKVFSRQRFRDVWLDFAEGQHAMPACGSHDRARS